MTKWPVQNQTHRTIQKHAEHQDEKDIQNKLCFMFFGFFYFFNFLNDSFKRKQTPLTTLHYPLPIMASRLCHILVWATQLIY